jgi:hypothetical protein
VNRTIILIGLLVACRSSSRPDPLLPFDEANLAEWKLVCGSTLKVDQGPMRWVARDETMKDSDLYNFVEVVRWKCITQEWSLVFVAETKTGLVDTINIYGKAGMARTTFVDQVKVLVLPLVRTQDRPDIEAYLVSPEFGPSGCVHRRVFAGGLSFGGCWGDAYDTRPFFSGGRPGRLDGKDD